MPIFLKKLKIIVIKLNMYKTLKFCTILLLLTSCSINHVRLKKDPISGQLIHESKIFSLDTVENIEHNSKLDFIIKKPVNADFYIMSFNWFLEGGTLPEAYKNKLTIIFNDGEYIDLYPNKEITINQKIQLEPFGYHEQINFNVSSYLIAKLADSNAPVIFILRGKDFNIRGELNSQYELSSIAEILPKEQDGYFFQ